MEEIIEKFKKLPERERNYAIYSLMLSGHISFTELSNMHVKFLEAKNRENSIYLHTAAFALESFRPGGMLKGDFSKSKKSHNLLQNGLDGLTAKALLVIKHSKVFSDEFIDKEIDKLSKSAIDDEQEKVDMQINGI